MGLSSKQVSSDGLDWNQQTTLLQDQSLQLPKPPTIRRPQPQQNQQQQHEKLKCPRCDSTNTKFCYYNNYNKLQPRHFCKACKRHWTKGGTLRNVPVGGGRKNKRLKTSTPATVAATATKKNTHVQNLPLALGDHQKSISDIFYQSLFRPPPSWLQQQDFSDTGNLDGKNLIPNLPQTQNLLFPFSSSGSFESNPSSVSTFFKPPNEYSFIGDHDQSKNMEDPTVSGILAAASGGTVDQPWQMPAASYWNWDDMDTFTTTTDLQIPWDDSEMKP